MKYINFSRQGDLGAPEGSEKWEKVVTPPFSRIVNEAKNNLRAESLFLARSLFNLLPAAAAAAGKDDLLLTLGTGTEVIARAAKGGVNVKTQATTPAASDNALLIPVAGSNMIMPITAVSQLRFATRVNLTQISDYTSDATKVTSAILFFAGLNETQSNVDPTTDAGDGAGFIYAPSPGVAGAPVALTQVTGLPAASLPNWVLHQKVAGADTFIDSGVPVQAARDYELVVQYGPDLKPLFYIDNVLVGTGTGVATTGHSVGVVVGVQIQNSTPAGQLNFDARYAALERFIG